MKKFIFFILGCGLGSGVTYFIVRDKYERKLKSERDSMIKEVEDIKGLVNENKEEVVKDKTEELTKVYKGELTTDNLGFLVEKTDNKTEEKNEDIDENEPYIITAEEFDSKGYELRYWYIYLDDVLVDEQNNIITTQEAEYSLGNCLDQADWDNEYVMHIRNDSEETDYEIKRLEHDYIEDEDEEL